MKAFHETTREENREIDIQRNRCSKFLPHFHINLEVLIIKRGKHDITLNGTSYSFSDDTVVFFDSYDLHGYDGCELENRDDCVIIIPSEFAIRFNALRQNKRAECPFVKSSKLCDTILQIVDNVILKNNTKNVKCASTELILTLLLDYFNFSVSDYGTENQLIRSILDFISKNYREKISLPIIAKSLGYAQAHISRIFHKYLKVSIPQYVNDLRLEFVENQAKRKEKTITELIFDSGFNSIQSYYRNKARKNND